MNAFAVGGTIRATFTLAGALAERHDVEVVSVIRKRDTTALPLPAGVRLRGLSDVRDETLARAPLRRLLHEQPSVLISGSDRRYRAFSLLTDIALLRFLASVRDGVLIGTRPGLNLAIAHLASESVVRVGQDHMNLTGYSDALLARFVEGYPRLDLVSALTERDAVAYRELLGDRPPVECFPNAAPDVGGRRASLDDKVVIAAGRLTRQKAFGRLIDAWADVAPRHPDWRLRIFGEGPKRRSLERRIRRHGVGDSARVEHYTDRLHDEFARASLYVMTSRREGFPMVLLEAMGVGLPVVSVDCYTGPRDVITDGADGRIVPEEDRPALVEAMSELMADDAKRKAFGAAALESVARYDRARIAARWESRLHELCAAKPPGRRSIAGPVLNALRLRAVEAVRR
jgi:glycosyltransferase involved in cell wall biosynthesis